MMGFFDQLSAQTGVRITAESSPSRKRLGPTEDVDRAVEIVEIMRPSDSAAKLPSSRTPLEAVELPRRTQREDIHAPLPVEPSPQEHVSEIASTQEIIELRSVDDASPIPDPAPEPIDNTSETSTDSRPQTQPIAETPSESPTATLQAVFNWIAAGENVDDLADPDPYLPIGSKTVSGDPLPSLAQERPTGEQFNESHQGNRLAPAAVTRQAQAAPVAQKAETVHVQETDSSAAQPFAERQASDRAGDAIPSIRIGSISITVDAPSSPVPKPRPSRPSEPYTTQQPNNSATYLRRHYIIPH